jgi:hypothetical protein
MNQRDKNRRRAVRRIFVDMDMADLGFGGVSFPEYEYDTEADLAMSWLANGLSPIEVATRVARYIRRDWDVPVSDHKVEDLSHALELLRAKPEWQG